MNYEVKDAKLPVATKGAKKGSMYLNEQLIAAVNGLPADASKCIHVPTMDKSTPNKMLQNIPWYLNKDAAAKVTDANPVAAKFVGRISKNADGLEIGIDIWRKA